jgi:hypothetical protein
VWETPTLRRLFDFCVAEEGGVVFYLHNKGASHVWPRAEFIRDWRRYMERHLLKKGGGCRRAVENGCDMCGVDFRSNDGDVCFEGNFWWAACSYVRTLQHPDRLLEMAKRKGRRPGDLAEFWIGTGPRFKALSLYESGIEHYIDYHEEADGLTEEQLMNIPFRCL